MLINNKYRKIEFFSLNISLLLIHLLFKIITVKTEITYCHREAPILVSKEIQTSILY